KSPVQPTCADGRDTYREIERRECASRLAASARFSAQFCPQGDTRGKEFLSCACRQKWVPPGALRFCDTLQRGRKTQKTAACGKEGKLEVFNLFKKSTKSCHKLAVY